MSATSIFFNGRVIRTPGSYSEVDATGLEQVGLGASGIVAVLGTAEGGMPASEMTESADFLRFTLPEKMRAAFRSGDLKDAAMIFEPSSDPLILAGAQEVVAMKINPATQSQASLTNADGTCLLVESADYGAFTAQTTITVSSGTNQGKLLTLALENTTETFDDVGGDTLFSLQYGAPTGDGGWEVMKAQALSTGIRCNGERTDTGLDGDVSASIAAGEKIQVVSSAASLSTSITVYGTNTSNNPQSETLTLSGGTTTSGTKTWNKVLGAILNAVPGGTATVDVQDESTSTVLLAFTASDLKLGVKSVSAMFVADSAINFASSGTAADDVLLWGTSAAGARQSEKLTLSTTANVYAASSLDWATIDTIVLGDVAAATTVTLAATAAQTTNVVHNTLAKVQAYFDSRALSATVGFLFTMVTAQTTKQTSLLDFTSGAGSSIFGVDVDFTADLDAIVQKLTLESSLVVPSRIAFTPQIRDLVITAGSLQTFIATINGTSVTYTSDATGTVAEIQAGLIALINSHKSIYPVVTATANDVDVRITAATPASFSLAVSGTGTMTISVVQDTAGTGYTPANQGPTTLAGGTEGTATFSNWQNALNLLKQVRVNSVVALSGDPAIHAAVEAHCAYMCGIGRSERDAFVGLSALDSNDAPLNTLPTKTSTKAQIVNLNSRHIRAFAQSIDKYDSEGARTTYLPWFQALLAAGMQAGSPVGTSLTHKYANVLSVTQSSSWNPTDDTEEMIAAGLCFMENVDGIGRRFVRNITTYLVSSNLAFTEGSVNEAANYATYEFRTALEEIVGRRGLLATVNDAKGRAITKLAALVEEGVLVQYRSLAFELTADVLEVSVEIAPVIPINFVKSTVHLVTVTQLV